MVEAGARDRLVTIQQRADAETDSGFPGDDWTTLATAYVSKRDLSVRERYSANQLSAPGDTEWQMPYRPDMDPELVDVAKERRLSYRGRFYDITGAKHDGLREGIVLTTIVKTS